MAVNSEGNEIVVKTHKQADEVAVTAQKLLAIAEERTPAPVIKFPVYSINILDNPTFFGREQELQKLHQLLIKDHTEAKPAARVLRGSPGVGKTQVALRFVYGNKTEFDAIFWVDADPENRIGTMKTFGNIGRRLGLFKDETIEDSQVEIVLNWLQTAGMGIVTEISRTLGESPLYLATAQAFMTTSGTALPEYLTRIESRSHLGSLVDQGGDYKKAVDATHDCLIQQLDPGAAKKKHLRRYN